MVAVVADKWVTEAVSENSISPESFVICLNDPFTAQEFKSGMTKWQVLKKTVGMAKNQKFLHRSWIGITKSTVQNGLREQAVSEVVHVKLFTNSRMAAKPCWPILKACAWHCLVVRPSYWLARYSAKRKRNVLF
jgi:hypothetical protein